jgi:glucose-1-phosphate adenylyltransferase
MLDHAMLRRSVLVERGARLEHCIIMERSRIGRGAQVRRCIIDQDNDIPADERIGYDLEQDRKRFHVTPSGIVVVPAGAFPARKSTSSPFLAPMDQEAQMGESVRRMEVLA